MANKVFRTSVNANEAIKAANEFDGGLIDRFIIRQIHLAQFAIEVLNEMRTDQCTLNLTIFGSVSFRQGA